MVRNGIVINTINDVIIGTSHFLFFSEREAARSELFGKSFARRLDFRTVACNFYGLWPHPPMITEWSHFTLTFKSQ